MEGDQQSNQPGWVFRPDGSGTGAAPQAQAPASPTPQQGPIAQNSAPIASVAPAVPIVADQPILTISHAAEPSQIVQPTQVRPTQTPVPANELPPIAPASPASAPDNQQPGQTVQASHTAQDEGLQNKQELQEQQELQEFQDSYFEDSEDEPAAPFVSGATYDQPQSAPAGDFTWSATETASHEKGIGWFMILGLASVAMAAVMYFVTHSPFTAGAIVIMGIVVGIFGAHQPRALQYVITNDGLDVGSRHYNFGMFKSFSMVHEGPAGFISLMPMKRFMPPIAVHYDPADEEKVVDALSSYLPFEEHENDFIERLSHKFRL